MGRSRMNTPRTRSGLTLVELLVVLAILAVLTMVAVSLTDGVVDQGRYDVTRRTIENIESAILGPANQTDADGSKLVVGFVADVGRPPIATGTLEETQLAELWANVNGLPGFGPRSPTKDADAELNDPQITILAGWRGPYLALPPQSTVPAQLLDGWAQPFLQNFDPSSKFLLALASRPGLTPGYDVPLTNTRDLTAVRGTLNGSIVDSDVTTPGANDVRVVVFYPDMTKADFVGRQKVTATAASGYAFVFPNPLPIGTAALRVTQGARKSSITYVRVPPGGLTRSIPFDVQ